MRSYNYEYGTTPKKVKTYEKEKKQNKYNEQLETNKRQKLEAMKLEKKKHNQNVAFIIAVFLILLVISYRSSLINEKFSDIQKNKTALASLQKTNDQLKVSIEESLNLKNVEATAKEKLGMQKLDNEQKVFVSLDKKDYLVASNEEINIVQNEEETNWIIKLFNKIFK